MKRSLVCLVLLFVGTEARSQSIKGYYRYPTIHGDTVIFASEGDLWRTGVTGGVARRLTSHPGDESNPAISPDGNTLAFTAQYEGPTEVYTMSLDGGLPTRRTFAGGNTVSVGWTPDGKILCTTDGYSTLPDDQLLTIELQTGKSARLPLSQAR